MIREAAIKQSWAKLNERDRHPFCPTKLQIDAHPLFAAHQEISLSPGITAFCGTNGSGKTRLMKLLADLFQGEPLKPDVDAVLDFGEKAVTNEAAKELLAITEPDGLRTMVLKDIPAILGAFPISENDLAPIGEAQLPADFAQLASWILFRDYENIRIYDVASEVDDISTLPYIVVNDQHRSYDVSEMGAGELTSLLLLWWISRAPAQSVIIIEEPETFLAPQVQLRLLDFIADLSIKKQIAVAVTTHSPDLLARIDITNIRLLTIETNGVAVRPAESHAQLRDRVGLRIAKRGIVALEDNRAIQLLLAIFSVHNPLLIREYQLRDMKGDGGVLAVQQLAITNTKDMHVIGLLDGDMRASNLELAPNVFYLPGTTDPDEICCSSLSIYANLVAKHFGLAATDVDQAILNTRATEKHDRIYEVSTRLAVGPQVLADLLFRQWAADPSNLKSCQEFLAELTSYIGALDS